jgi:hypothetical protein
MRTFLVILAAFGLQATLEASSLCSTIIDLANQPLHGAKVTIVNLIKSERKYSAVADQTGKVCVNPIPEGTYSVEASLFGFMNVRYYPVRVAFPNDVNLTFQLPFGEITEGEISEEATLSGTLEGAQAPSPTVRICLFEERKQIPIVCTNTNDLGEYALIVQPGVYRLELTRLAERVQATTIDMSHPGYYRNRVSLPVRPPH